MKKLLALLTLLITTPSYAFTLAPADQSVQYLGSLFGHIGSVLHGNASPMVGQLFFVFNWSVLLLCIILIIYTLFTGILKNSEDGEAMGRQPLSKWIPIRMVLGIGMLLPSVSGYSVLQALVMWVVLQGAAAGDLIWNAAVDGIFNGGAVSPPATLTSNSTANQALYTAATHLLSAQVCVDAMQSVYGNSGDFSCKVHTLPGQLGGAYIVCGGTLTDNQGNTSDFGTMCGIVAPNYDQIPQYYPNQNGLSNTPIYVAISQALPQMLQAVQPTAQVITNNANEVLEGVPAYDTEKVPGNAITNAVNIYQRLVGGAISVYVTQANRIQMTSDEKQQCNPAAISTLQNQINDMYSGNNPFETMQIMAELEAEIQKTAKVYAQENNLSPQQEYQMMMKGENKLNNAHNPIQAEQMLVRGYEKTYHCYVGDGLGVASPQQMKATGWFDAGQYYLAIAEKSYLHANTMKFADASGAQTLPGLRTIVIDTKKLPGTIWQTYAAAVQQYADADSAQYFENQSAPSWITQSEVSPSSNQGAEYVVQAIDTSLTQWNNLFNALQGNTNGQYANPNAQKLAKFYDPIMLLQQFGHVLMVNTVQAYKLEGAYFDQQSFHEWLSNIFGSLFGNNDYDRMISAMWYLPLGTTILSMMMVSGMMLAIYLPLIPFMMFVLAGIGWLLGVMEAIVAVPIVCFGIMHPRGDHNVLGKSEPGLMLLVNIFIRPALIILSLLLGIGLLFIALEVINNGFSQVAGSMLTMSSNLRDPFTATCLIAIYTLFIVMVAQKCFSMISIVPDSVLRWIQGGNATQEQFGEMGKVMEQMDQMAGSGAQQLSQGMAKTSQAQAQGQLDIAKNNAAVEDNMLKL